jgi:6-phosphogluconolactonase
MVMGLGADGHTASLFPGSPALKETERWVVPSRASYEPIQRLTMTLPVFNNSRALHFLVAGADKRAALACALGEPTRSCPASLVRPPEGAVTWWVDEAAAGRPADS